MARRIIVLGAPGAGKGTQAQLLAAHFGIAHISTGEMFRAAVEAKSELGKKVSGFLDKGELVPNELTVDLVKERIQQDDCKDGFVLDGFPRNLEQAEALEAALQGMDLSITHVLYFKVPEAELVRRVMERAASGSGRSDDTREVIENRLKVYEEQTAPLISFYKNKGLLNEIDGVGSVESISELCKEKL